MQDSVRSGAVDWTGDNPFIYLKTDAQSGAWSSLSLYFRIAISPHGAGQAMLVLEAPGVARSDAVRLCLTDNAALARYLLDGFVKRFALFRTSTGIIDALEVVAGARFECQDRGAESHVQTATQPERGLTVTMGWQGLGRAFAVDMPPAQTQTGEHEMFSVFRPAQSAHVSVGGRRLPGQTAERDFFGGRAQSAALAFGESWVRA
ncbi:MAG: NAD-dependent dehydratase [Burkholderiales bacterium]|nr:NAD-dependent dehydratase [Burkholderiales bacterium]MDE2398814.1 NAD-dependent dehydratase [Burkholderiales bacterium]MDE2455009.1 NAD-dependent dehydratase [Burkholderiales bacterium]